MWAQAHVQTVFPVCGTRLFTVFPARVAAQSQPPHMATYLIPEPNTLDYSGLDHT